MRIIALTPEEVKALPARGNGRKPADLSEYVAYVSPLEVGSWHRLELDADEKPSLIRRRLLVAGRESGKTLMFRKAESENGTTSITFKVDEHNPDSYQKRADRAKELTAIRRAKSGTKRVKVAI